MSHIEVQIFVNKQIGHIKEKYRGINKYLERIEIPSLCIKEKLSIIKVYIFIFLK